MCSQAVTAMSNVARGTISTGKACCGRRIGEVGKVVSGM